MGCNCRVVEAFLAVLIIIFVVIDTVASDWIIVISAVIMLIHALACKMCMHCCTDCAMPMKKMKKEVKRKTRSRRRR